LLSAYTTPLLRIVKFELVLNDSTSALSAVTSPEVHGPQWDLQHGLLDPRADYQLRLEHTASAIGLYWPQLQQH